jgi:hypothetical protein
MGVGFLLLFLNPAHRLLKVKFQLGLSQADCSSAGSIQFLECDALRSFPVCILNVVAINLASCRFSSKNRFTPNRKVAAIEKSAVGFQAFLVNFIFAVQPAGGSAHNRNAGIETFK